MDGIAKQAFESLGPFVVVQFAVAAAVFYGIWAAATRGQRDNGAKPDAIPQWVLIGPMHDMMGAVHDVAEETRRTNDLLREFRDLQNDILRELQNARQTLEMIRNESRMR